MYSASIGQKGEPYGCTKLSSHQQTNNLSNKEVSKEVSQVQIKDQDWWISIVGILQ